MKDAWSRRLKLLHYMMRKGFAQTADVARYLEIDRRKARDDFEALSTHGVPLSVHPEDPTDPDRTWKLEQSWRMTGLEVRLLERLALLLGKEVLEPLLGPSELGAAMNHLEHELASVADGVEASDSELLRRFHLVQEPSKSYDAQGPLVSELVQAIAFSYCVTVRYRNPNAPEPRLHERIKPLTLAIYRRGLYVFVTFSNGKIGPLSIDRIVSLEPHQEETFDYPTPGRWDPARFLAHRFGLTPGSGQPEEVHLRVPVGSKVYALERPSMTGQKITEREDGGVDITFKADGAELANQVLFWGGYCEVLSPPWLRARVLELAKSLVARHEGPPSPG